VNDLVIRFRNGDEAAARELYDRFAGEMRNLVCRQLARSRARAVHDSEGVLQSAFRSFFSAINKPAFDPTRSSIGGLLNRIVYRKACRTLRRKCPDAYAPEDIEVVRDTTATLLDAGLSEPEVEAAMREAVGVVLAEFTDREREVLERYLDPWAEQSIDEIAKACRKSHRTVTDVIAQFTARLQALAAGAG
jgi:RNA polymerase sigma factor (sigma-70 family)